MHNIPCGLLAGRGKMTHLLCWRIHGLTPAAWEVLGVSEVVVTFYRQARGRDGANGGDGRWACKSRLTRCHYPKFRLVRGLQELLGAARV